MGKGGAAMNVLVERVPRYDVPLVRPQCTLCGKVGPGCGDMSILELEAARHSRRCPARFWGLMA